MFDKAWLDERDEYFAGIYDDLLELRHRGVFANKKIAVVGTWTNTVEVNDILGRLGLKLTHIADNNPTKQGVSKLGIVTQSVNSLVHEENLIILVFNHNSTNIYWHEIQNQLLGLGLKKDKDFYIVFGGEKFERRFRPEYFSKKEYLEECKEKARSAYEAYLDIEKKHKGLPVWLMHQPSIGDLYIFSLFLPHEMGVGSIPECECVLVVAKNSTKNLAVALGYKYIELITFEEAHNNWLPLMRMMGERLNVKNAVYHGMSNVFQRLVHCSTVSFRDSFTEYVFQFENAVNPIYPAFPKRKEHVLKQFKEYGLNPGRTVVISPYAGHFIAHISGAQWNSLVSALAAKGYSVCTNCGTPDELPLPGTAAPFIEIQDCVEFVETAGYFVGVRSGFCDLVCTAGCQKIVIYETGAPAASIDYFGFKCMDIGDDNIIELINDCINTDKLVDDIVKLF